jgi:hypothetical protein
MEREHTRENRNKRSVRKQIALSIHPQEMHGPYTGFAQVELLDSWRSSRTPPPFALCLLKSPSAIGAAVSQSNAF